MATGAPDIGRALTGTVPASTRIPSIDGFRGLAVLLMALGNFEIGVRAFPPQLKHTPDLGFRIADLVAPMFIVAISLTVGESMRRRRASEGVAAARWHLVTRGLTLVGTGAIISAGEGILNPTPGIQASWGVLQCIGASTLLLLPFVFQPAWVRVVVGVSCLAAFQWMLDHHWRDLVLHSAHNGLVGTLSWAGLLMIATAVGDAYRATQDARRQTRLLVLVGLLSTAGALLLSTWVAVSKNRASATYMLLSLGLGLIVFAAFHVALGARPAGLRWLQRVGRNALLLYLANLLMLAAFRLPGTNWWYAGAPLWLSLVQAAVIAAANVGLAAYLDRRGWVLTL